MNEVYFKHLVDEQKIAISLRFVQDIHEKKVDRIFNFVRLANEDVSPGGVSMTRIKNNLEKELNKKLKKSKKKSQGDETVEETLQVRLKLFYLCNLKFILKIF